MKENKSKPFIRLLAVFLFLTLIVEVVDIYVSNSWQFKHNPDDFYFGLLDIGVRGFLGVSLFFGLIKTAINLRSNWSLRYSLLFGIFLSILNFGFFLTTELPLGFNEDLWYGEYENGFLFWQIVLYSRFTTGVVGTILWYALGSQKRRVVASSRLTVPKWQLLKRLLAFIVDLILAVGILIMVSEWMYGFFNTSEELFLEEYGVLGIVIPYALSFFIYYFFFESCYRQTVGQAVVNNAPWAIDHSDRYVYRILQRSLFRLIPFNPFSAFSGTCWHEKFSKTRTLPVNFEPDKEYWSIDSPVLDEGLINGVID